jgi:hypothetical protein
MQRAETRAPALAGTIALDEPPVVPLRLRRSIWLRTADGGTAGASTSRGGFAIAPDDVGELPAGAPVDLRRLG